MFTLEQILLSILFNGAALLAIQFLKSAPPRIVLYFCLVGMLGIAVPWSYIGTGVESYVPSNAILEASIPSAVSESVIEREGSASTLPIVAIWLVVGVGWLVLTILRSVYTKRRWRSNALCGNALRENGHTAFNKILLRARIRRIPDSSKVFATGLWHPEIWIGNDIRTTAQIEAALNHELAHIESNDQFTLFLVVALERLLWWNPLIWLLGRQARRQMEYACDSRCQSLIGATKYRRSLAELFLVQQPRTLSLELTLGHKSDIINRLEKIGMKHFIKLNHILILILIGSLTAVTSASFAGQKNTKSPTLIECHELLPDGVQYDFKISSAIDTREGRDGNLSVSLVDQSKPDSRDVPIGAGDFLKCVQKVVGVGNDKGWPES